MSDGELLSYVVAVTGVVGAVTGIAGAVMGFISYRRSKEMKTLDLRLELMKLLTQLFHECKWRKQVREWHIALSLGKVQAGLPSAAG